MDPAAVVLGVLGGIVALTAAVTTLVVKTDRRPFEHLLARPNTPIAEVRDGAEVTIFGTARAEPGALLVSPVTRRPCIAWWQSTRIRSIDDMAMLTAEITLRCGTFTVHDDTGAALVDGGEGGVLLLYLDDATARSDDFIVEHVLEDGARVLVAGVASVTGGEASGYRGTRRVEIHVGGRRHPLVVSNLRRYVARSLARRS